MPEVLRLAYRLKAVWAVLLALLVGAALIGAAGHAPLEAYAALFHGAFLDYYGIATTLVKLSPLLLAGLAVVLPLRGGLFNIGAEGQIYLGALFTTVVALHLPAMPGWLGILLCSVAGAIGGGLWGLIPGYLKAARGVNEVLVTLLMNYVAINLISYFVSGPMMAEGAPYPYSDEIRQDLSLPHVLAHTDAHIGVVIALVLAFAMYFVFQRTSVGFSIDTVGRNQEAARYAGISVRWHVVLSLACGGAIAGLAGALEVLGLKYRLFHLFGGGYGYDGIVVAFLAEANPLSSIAAATFLAGLKSGANIMQRAVGVPITVIEAIEGLVVIFVAASLPFGLRRGDRAGLWRRRKAIDAALIASDRRG